MLFLKKLAGFIYFVVMLASGLVFVAVALEILPVSLITDAVDTVRGSMNARIAVGLSGIVIALTGVVIFGRSRKYKGSEKLITFQNPDGEVTVSVSAIENYVKRVAREIQGITDVRASAKVGKKGISITSFVTISAGTNIPEVTERIQMTVKSKVQDMLGVEEKITVTMHITKILKENEIPAGEPEDAVKTASPPFREID